MHLDRHLEPKTIETKAKTTKIEVVQMMKTLGGVAPHISLGYDFKKNSRMVAAEMTMPVSRQGLLVCTARHHQCLALGTSLGAVFSLKTGTVCLASRSNKAKIRLTKLVQKTQRTVRRGF